MSLYGVGICSKGKYTGRDGEGKITPEYTLWSNVLARCYSTKYQAKSSAFYQECYVCEDWLDFQVFAAWANSQPNFNRKGFALDKDLTIMGSKTYSPETCSFIPRQVNSLLKLNCSKTGVPLGVQSVNSKTNPYAVMHGGKSLGRFADVDTAFEYYKQNKLKEINIAANKYKEEISEKVYTNLINYEIIPYPDRQLLTPIPQ